MNFQNQQQTLCDGSVITATAEGEWIVFSGSRTGVHQLLMTSASVERALAHWEGYAQAAEQAAEQFIRSVAGIRSTGWGTRGVK